MAHIKTIGWIFYEIPTKLNQKYMNLGQLISLSSYNTMQQLNPHNKKLNLRKELERYLELIRNVDYPHYFRIVDNVDGSMIEKEKKETRRSKLLEDIPASFMLFNPKFNDDKFFDKIKIKDMNEIEIFKTLTNKLTELEPILEYCLDDNLIGVDIEY